VNQAGIINFSISFKERESVTKRIFKQFIDGSEANGGDGNDTLDANEFIYFLDSLGFEVPDEATESAIFSAFDKNDDEAIDFEEFQDFMKNRAILSVRAPII
jgi:Ca2+-binding EF-hand superfamily protein